jgi:hypothetical protein
MINDQWIAKSPSLGKSGALKGRGFSRVVAIIDDSGL